MHSVSKIEKNSIVPKGHDIIGISLAWQGRRNAIKLSSVEIPL
ncbi:hypothetical protein CLOSTMETH_02973 [[Clostridium] methylpentosum DSM 5476]|uniref:Uncharacterized protein n=1 Tax=[Clostridium] methylpentosum DSM 5476 TaxID=537013 RepID=C0EGI0_9FIRM|nr:hypothetical protein CLOSTMETH_02973 [[Clostridium] methylpentosum DSM 5476]